MGWYHWVGLGVLGAATGYVLLREKTGNAAALALGLGAATLPVAAFRPGGWLREA